MATSLEELEKEIWIVHIHANTYNLVKKIVKISPEDREIIVFKLKKIKKLTQAKYIARLASLPSRLNDQIYATYK